MNFNELEKKAFLEHASVRLVPIRKYLYAEKSGELIENMDLTRKHIQECPACQNEVSILKNTDPYLNT